METYKSKYTGEEVDNSVGIRTLVSKTAPTNRTQGNVGQFLFDSVTDITYQCKAVTLDTDGTKLYMWKNIMENVGAGDMAKSVYDPTNQARDVFKDIGDLTALETTEKGSTVGAINEVRGGICNPNLLDNAWFGKGVINGRGQISYSGASVYTIDRWHLGATGVQTANVLSDGIQIIGADWFSQPIAGKVLYGKTLTFSVETIDGIIYHGTGVLPSSSNAWDFVTVFSNSNFSLALQNYNNTDFQASIINDNGNNSFKRAKLELGSISTLHLDPPPNPQVELAKCQRYQSLISLLGNSYGVVAILTAVSTTQANGVLTLPTSMRIANPTLEFIQGVVTSLQLQCETRINLTALTVSAGTENGIKINATVAGGLTVGRAYSLTTASTTDIKFMINANL